MSKGVFTFEGGTDCLLDMMLASLREHGVDCESQLQVQKILMRADGVAGVVANGREIGARAVVSNGSLVRTVHEWVGDESFDDDYLAAFDREVEVSNSSCQVYIGIKPGEKLGYFGDLLFTSTHPVFDAAAIQERKVTSRTYSVYYPEIRPGSNQYTVVASMNACYDDWRDLAPDVYRARKTQMIEDTLDALEEYVPGIRSKVDFTEAATPRTFERYTGHVRGASFGTKFGGLKHSMELSSRAPGVFHTGSVGIIMSGWLGAANYGVITANEVEKYLTKKD